MDLRHVIALVAAGAANGQEERLELDWVFSDEGKAAMSLPRYAWLENDVVALYTRRTAKDRKNDRNG